MKTFSTGDIAGMCDVNLRTVIRWIERGSLKAYKLPGRGNNRVTEADFREFLNAHGMPVPTQLKPLSNRVLIVDDEAPMASAIQRVLRAAGFDTVVARDSFHAGARLLQDKPALLTLDLNMPTMDGSAVIRFVRENPEIANTRILVISAMGEPLLKKALLDGADAVLQKPFDNQELVLLAEQLLA